MLPDFYAIILFHNQQKYQAPRNAGNGNKLLSRWEECIISLFHYFAKLDTDLPVQIKAAFRLNKPLSER